MKVVILCGGFGTRIRDVSAEIPKPMVAIGQYPILWHIMKGYSRFGVKDFVLCLGYQSSVIKDFFVNYHVRTSDVRVALGTGQVETFSSHDEKDWSVTLAETGLMAQTGARLYRVRQYVQDEECFMLTYGDGVGNVEINALYAFHRSHGKLCTVTGVRPPGRFGELEIEGDQVKGFNEKPQVSAGRISGGYFVFDRRVFDYLNDREDLVFETNPMRSIVADGQMMVYRHDGFWQPMDTYRDYKLLNDLWSSGDAPWKTW